MHANIMLVQGIPCEMLRKLVKLIKQKNSVVHGNNMRPVPNALAHGC